MDIVFSDPSVADGAPTETSVLDHHVQLSLTLQQASKQATSSGHPTLASFTQPLPAYDPLLVFSIFQRLDLGNCLFWNRPLDHRALVGVGTTMTIETNGPDCIATTASAWRTLQQHTVIGKAPGATPQQTDGPVLLGGFAFDPLTPRTPLWQGFPDGLLVLPHLLFHCDETTAALTINILVQPAVPVEPSIHETSAILQRMETLLTQAHLRHFHDANSAEHLLIHDLLPPSQWMQQVAHAVQMIHNGSFEKVVLARSLEVTSPTYPFDVSTILHRLRSSYPKAYVFAFQRGKRYFLGATPERLLCGSDGQLQTMALAGSAPRGQSAEEDQQRGQSLMHSMKNQGEHHVVVTTIHNALLNLCSRVWVADEPRLLKLKNIQHLETPITGDLLPGHSILEALEVLHPTPAVGGFPRQPALETIRQYEQLDRGWYAAPIGWIGTNGNGEFAVALRSALLEAHKATLFAGCGIVADSDPESEYTESCLKLQVMLGALRGDLHATAPTTDNKTPTTDLRCPAGARLAAPSAVPPRPVSPADTNSASSTGDLPATAPTTNNKTHQPPTTTDFRCPAGARLAAPSAVPPRPVSPPDTNSTLPTREEQ